jgi:hypothetical protein
MMNTWALRLETKMKQKRNKNESKKKQKCVGALGRHGRAVLGRAVAGPAC